MSFRHDYWHVGGIPQINLDDGRRIIIDQMPGEYLGQPDTVLLADKKTIIAGYPEGHGHPKTLLKKSSDGGVTWGGRLPTPPSFENDHFAPCIHRLTDATGKERIHITVVTPFLMHAWSEDNGETWTDFSPMLSESFGKAPGYKGNAPPKSIVSVTAQDGVPIPGRYFALYHAHIQDKPDMITGIFRIATDDGGLTWSTPVQVGDYATLPGANPCAPCIIAADDSRRLLCVMRAYNQTYNALWMISDDGGESWSSMSEASSALKGVRHILRWTPDGRILAVFRDLNADSPTNGDCVAWVGTWDDIVSANPGQYRVRLLHNHSPRPADTGYQGLELLPDGTFVMTTYCSLESGQPPAVVCVRFMMEELDRAVKAENAHNKEIRI